jgi:Flp pilus assembly protein TadD
MQPAAIYKSLTNEKKRTFHFFLIAIVGILIYSNTFTAPFVFDDEYNIVDNPVIKNIGNFISSTNGYAFNPRRFVGYLTFALNYRFGGYDVTGYHAVNLLIHIINALLLYSLIGLTFRTPYFRLARSADPDSYDTVALFASLLFVAHPIQTQAVTYVVQRFTSLATLFYLSALVCYARGRLSDGGEAAGIAVAERRRRGVASGWPFYLFSVLFAVLAMKTKEIAFTLPLVVLVYEFAFFRSDLKKRLLVLIPLALTLAVVPLSLLNAHRPLGELLSDLSERTRVDTLIPRTDYLLTEMRVIMTYIRLLFFPVNQSLDYDYPVYHTLFALPVFLSCIFIVSLLLLCAYLFHASRLENMPVSASGKRGGIFPSPFLRLAAFGIAWFFIALSVESSFIPITDVIFEHRVYLPSAGFFIFVGACVVLLKKMLVAAGRPAIARSMALLMVAVIAVLSIATYARNSVWNDPGDLWRDVTEKNPGSFRGHYNLGTLESQRNHLAEAARELEKAVSLNHGSAKAHDNLGMVYGRQGLMEKALGELRTAVRLNPGNVHAHQNLRKVYEEMGRYADADRELNYSYAIMHYRKGAELFRQGRVGEAERELQAALALSPDYPEAHAGMGILLDKEGRLYDAMAEFRTAIALKGDYAEAHNDLGMIYAKLGLLEEAVKELETAVRLAPDYLVATKNLKRIEALARKKRERANP